MTEPLVSIIMPAHNAEQYIAESIQSVLDQTYQTWELIVVDDGSKDRTAAIAKGFSSSDHRIKYTFQENRKLAAARNTGIKNATGNLIAFLDADDLWMPNKLRLQVETIKATNAGVVFSDGFIFPDDDRADESRPFSTSCGKFSGDEMFDLLLVINRLPMPSVLAQREVLSKAGLFDEDPRYHYGCEDYDLWIRAARDGAVFYGMPERLVRYRVHRQAMSGKKIELLQATIATLDSHRPEGAATTRAIRKRYRDLYRDLATAFLEENRLNQARACVKELAKWDRLGFVTVIQRVLINILPGKFNSVSARLYEVGSSVHAFRTTWRQAKCL